VFCDNGLRVKLDTLSSNIFHFFVDVENKVYTRYTIPKKDIILEHELTISHRTRLVYKML
jgi:hypothetical protein